jgi:hypothetical protein
MQICINTECGMNDSSIPNGCKLWSNESVFDDIKDCSKFKPRLNVSSQDKPVAKTKIKERIMTKPKSCIELLRKIEWSGDSHSAICPLCRRMGCDGHTENCEVSEALGNPSNYQDTQRIEELETMLEKIQKALHLTGKILPDDIDETIFEYSAFGEIRSGEWSESWIERKWCHCQCLRDSVDVLTRRRRKVSIEPTDNDAIEQPRRPCLVRDRNNENWISATLIAVGDESQHCRFFAMKNGHIKQYFQARIEIEK